MLLRVPRQQFVTVFRMYPMLTNNGRPLALDEETGKRFGEPDH